MSSICGQLVAYEKGKDSVKILTCSLEGIFQRCEVEHKFFVKPSFSGQPYLERLFDEFNDFRRYFVSYGRLMTAKIAEVQSGSSIEDLRASIISSLPSIKGRDISTSTLKAYFDEAGVYHLGDNNYPRLHHRSEVLEFYQLKINPVKYRDAKEAIRYAFQEGDRIDDFKSITHGVFDFELGFIVPLGLSELKSGKRFEILDSMPIEDFVTRVHFKDAGDSVLASVCYSTSLKNETNFIRTNMEKIVDYVYQQYNNREILNESKQPTPLLIDNPKIIRVTFYKKI